MNASEFMTKEVITCKESQTVGDAAKIMFENGISVMLVVDDNDHLTGIVTESDFVGKEVNVPRALASIKQLFGHTFHSEDIESIYSSSKSKPLGEIMTENPTSIGPDTSLTSIVDLMQTKHLKRLPVTSDNKVVGIVTRKDLLKAYNQIK